MAQMKSDFLSTAAHELRSPMASIRGFAELLTLRKFDPERSAEILQTIHRQTVRLSHLINELLDLARIESRRALDFEFSPQELRALVSRVAEDFGVPEGREPVELVLPDAPQWVHVDPAKLGQALRNLLSNAYKYSPQGGPVALRVRPLDGGLVALEVEDRGMGMTPEELERVTERFFRADKSGAIPGSGLGMSIVKEIVGLMGGQLQLASVPLRGTCVTVQLPLVPAPFIASNTG